MTKREALRQAHQETALFNLGFTRAEADQLRRISIRLQRWFELECGTGDGQVSRSIERDGDDGDGKPFLRVQYPTTHGYVDRRTPIRDLETGARKRLARIVDTCNAARRTNTTDGALAPLEPLAYFVQTDPRGAALYILRPGDVPAGADPHAYYSRGIVVH
jgi:hypothetical protein